MARFTMMNLSEEMITKLFLIIIVAKVFIASDEYGPFDLKITKVIICKGSKVKNCANMTIQKWKNGKGFLISADIVQSCSPQVGKVTAISKGKELMRLQMNKPCEHLFLRPILDKFLNVTDNCVVKKGTYTNEINIEKIAKDYFAGSFVYGNLTFKSALYSKDCNMFCVNLDVMMYPLGSK